MTTIVVRKPGTFEVVIETDAKPSAVTRKLDGVLPDGYLVVRNKNVVTIMIPRFEKQLILDGT